MLTESILFASFLICITDFFVILLVNLHVIDSGNFEFSFLNGPRLICSIPSILMLYW